MNRTNSEAPKPLPTSPQPLQKLLPSRISALAAVAVILVGAATYLWQQGQRGVTTEDAYVEGNVVQVTSQVGGVVTAILADNTDHIKTGQTLVTLNAVDAQLALDGAEAQLARTVRQVRGQFATAGHERANVRLKSIDLTKARADLARRSELVSTGAISGEELVHANQAVQTAEASLAMAGEEFQRNQALVERTSVASHPDVRAAQAKVRDASIALSRTSIPAPVGGVITKRNVQVGQRINAGVALMSVVPLDHLWVTANLKESQLRNVRAGQPVSLTTDIYGRQVVFHGKVIGQDPGTGSAFSLLPAQNATGNWIKIVQRVPVRIALDATEVAAHPLQVGLSMHVSVNTRYRGGERLAPESNQPQQYKTTVFADEMARADEIVKRVTDANL